jgi:hypothetical protein
MIKKKTYMIIHIPIKQMWLEENIIDKRCIKMGGSKNAKKPNEKMVLYSISKDQRSKSG